MMVETLVTKAGSLEIFTKHELEGQDIVMDFPGYYWRDKHGQCDHSFPSVHAAMEDHVANLEYRQLHGSKIVQMPVILKGMLISVDFVNKRRVG